MIPDGFVCFTQELVSKPEAKMDVSTRLKEKIGGMDDIIDRLLALLSEWSDSTASHPFFSFLPSHRIEASRSW